MKLNQFYKRVALKMGVHLSLAFAFFVYLPLSMVGPSSTVEQTGVVWSADHETGNLSQWSQGTSLKSEQDSGTCSRPPNGISTDVARSGKYSMKMNINSTVQGSGCRQFRYPEVLSGQAYYYSAWFYYPQKWNINGWTNVFQFKSRPPNGESDPLWFIRVNNRANGNMFYDLRWKGGTYNLSGPQSSNGMQDNVFSQSVMDIPVAKWTHLEVYFRQSSQFSGRITVWQDGVQIFDFDNIKTKYVDGDNRWSVNNYGLDISPNPVVLYVDDAVVSTTRLGIGTSGQMPSPTPAPTQPPVPTAAPTQTPSPTAAPTQPPSTSKSIKINFLPSDAAAAPGYLSDTGKEFGDRGNGYKYGWNKNNSTNARDRNSNLSPNQAYDTFNHLQMGGNYKWQIALPNGIYTVRIVAGDADFYNSTYKIDVEGVVVINGTPTSSTRWLDGTASVKVNDGKLTVTNGSNSQNNKICFIEIITP